MGFLKEHWLSIGTAVFLLAMVLYGHYRGFLRLAVTMVALILTLVVVQMASPYVSGFLRENTSVRHMIEQGLLNVTGAETTPEADIQFPAGQRSLIEELHLPVQMREALLENNNNEMYRLLGVDAFMDYIGAYLTNMVLNIVGSILLFVVVYIGIRLLIRWLGVLARLPILYGINQIAGAILGGAQGLLIIWGLCLLVTACANTVWGGVVLQQIETSAWLTFLYQNNIFNWFITSILTGRV